MIEAFVVVAVLIGGCLFVLSAGIGGWALAALGYVTGMCLLIDFGFLQILSGFATSPILTLTLTVATPLIWWLSQRHPQRLRPSPIYVAITLIGVLCLIYFFRHAHLVGWSNDSLRYLEIGALIAGDNFDAVTPNLLTQRLLAFPIIHAPANLAGEFYLRSAGPLLGIATLGVFIWLSSRGLTSNRAHYATIFAALGVALIVTNNRMIWSAFALYPHLLTAVLMLLIAGVGWLMAVTESSSNDEKIDQRALIFLQSIAMPALVVARPEGSLMAAIAILPTLLCGPIAMRYRALLLCVLGSAVVAWNLLIITHWAAGAEEIPGFVLGPLAFGGLMLAACATLFSATVQKHMNLLENRASLILIAAEAALWLALGLAAVMSPDVLSTSLNATTRNLFYGEGGWGYSLVILALLVFVCSVAARGGNLILIRFPVTSFVPIAFLLAVLRDSPYRIGLGDSLNRMWIHIVPLAVLFIVAAMSSGRWPILSRWRERDFARR